MAAKILSKFDKPFCMKTIKGVYEDGKIKLLEEPPAHKSNKVLVTFIDTENEMGDIRELSLQQLNAAFSNYLQDEREDLHQEYLKKTKA